MPSMTTTQVKDAATLWQSQQVDDAINISLCSLTSKNRFIDVKIVFSKECFIPWSFCHGLLLLLYFYSGNSSAPGTTFARGTLPHIASSTHTDDLTGSMPN